MRGVGRVGEPTAVVETKLTFRSIRVGILDDMSAEIVHPTPEGRDTPPLPQERFLNREESWLQFNQRVLEMAEDSSIPLLERVRFLAIFASNLDEFFMVRVAGLKRRMATGLLLRTKSGLKPREELARIATVADKLAIRHAECFHTRILPAARRRGDRGGALGRSCQRRAGPSCASCSGSGSGPC